MQKQTRFLASLAIASIAAIAVVALFQYSPAEPTPDEYMGAKLVGVMCFKEEQNNEKLDGDMCLNFCEDTFRNKKSERLCKNGYTLETLTKSAVETATERS